MGASPQLGSLHLKATPLAQLAGNVDIAAVGLHDLLGNGQPQPSPPRCSGALLIHPVEAFKNMGQIRCRNADAVVCDLNPGAASPLRQADFDPTGPAGVYLQAFESKFAMACRSRSGSAFTQTP